MDLNSLVGSDLVIYGHSWTNGYHLPDPSMRYARLLANSLSMRFGDTIAHSRGQNGSHVWSAMERLYGETTEGATWDVGTTDALVVVQSLMNTLRWKGADPLVLTTARHALRAMCGTVQARQRVEEESSAIAYQGDGWHMSNYQDGGSGGFWKGTDTSPDYFAFTADGGERVMLRGRPGDAPIVRFHDWDIQTDDPNDRVFREIDLARQVDPDIAVNGIPVLTTIPSSKAGRRIRVYRTADEGRTGNLSLDVILRARKTYGTQIVLVKEPYLADWGASATYKNGSDAACDAFNALIDEMGESFTNVIVADPAPYWNKNTMLLDDGTHPNEAGHRAIRDAIIAALRQA